MDDAPASSSAFSRGGVTRQTSRTTQLEDTALWRLDEWGLDNVAHTRHAFTETAVPHKYALATEAAAKRDKPASVSLSPEPVVRKRKRAASSAAALRKGASGEPWGAMPPTHAATARDFLSFAHRTPSEPYLRTALLHLFHTDDAATGASLLQLCNASFDRMWPRFCTVTRSAGAVKRERDLLRVYAAIDGAATVYRAAEDGDPPSRLGRAMTGTSTGGACVAMYLEHVAYVLQRCAHAVEHASAGNDVTACAHSLVRSMTGTADAMLAETMYTCFLVVMRSHPVSRHFLSSLCARFKRACPDPAVTAALVCFPHARVSGDPAHVAAVANITAALVRLYGQSPTFASSLRRVCTTAHAAIAEDLSSTSAATVHARSMLQQYDPAAAPGGALHAAVTTVAATTVVSLLTRVRAILSASITPALHVDMMRLQLDVARAVGHAQEANDVEHQISVTLADIASTTTASLAATLSTAVKKTASLPGSAGVRASMVNGKVVLIGSPANTTEPLPLASTPHSAMSMQSVRSGSGVAPAPVGRSTSGASSVSAVSVPPVTEQRVTPAPVRVPSLPAPSAPVEPRGASPLPAPPPAPPPAPAPASPSASTRASITAGSAGRVAGSHPPGGRRIVIRECEACTFRLELTRAELTPNMYLSCTVCGSLVGKVCAQPRCAVVVHDVTEDSCPLMALVDMYTKSSSGIDDTEAWKRANEDARREAAFSLPALEFMDADDIVVQPVAPHAHGARTVPPVPQPAHGDGLPVVSSSSSTAAPLLPAAEPSAAPSPALTPFAAYVPVKSLSSGSSGGALRRQNTMMASAPGDAARALRADADMSAEHTAAHLSQLFPDEMELDDGDFQEPVAAAVSDGSSSGAALPPAQPWFETVREQVYGNFNWDETADV